MFYDAIDHAGSARGRRLHASWIRQCSLPRSVASFAGIAGSSTGARQNVLNGVEREKEKETAPNAGLFLEIFSWKFFGFKESSNRAEKVIAQI